jgi:hypothetical protein
VNSARSAGAVGRITMTKDIMTMVIVGADI